MYSAVNEDISYNPPIRARKRKKWIIFSIYNNTLENKQILQVLINIKITFKVDFSLQLRFQW